MGISALIDQFEILTPSLRPPLVVEGVGAMVFRSVFDKPGARPEEVSVVGSCPGELAEFWKLARGATLFKDETFGQWGLRILDPTSAIATLNTQASLRPDDFRRGDLIIGEFIGDSDRLVIRCNPEAADYGHVVVANATDPRDYWFDVANSFAGFLSAYLEHKGEKYWERS